MPYDSGSVSYKDPVTIQWGNQMAENVVRISEHRINGCELSVTGTSTVEVMPGSMELNGAWLTETTTANLVLTAENNTHWEEGTSQELSSTSMYIVAYNSAGSTFSVKFRASGPAYSDTNSATAGIKRYDKTGTIWYRYIGAVWNDTTNAILPMRHRDDDFQLYQPTTALGAGDASGELVILYNVSGSAWITATIDFLPFIDAVPTLFIQHPGGTFWDIKPADLIGNASIRVDTTVGATKNEFTIPTNALKEIAYFAPNNVVAARLWLKSYTWQRGD